MTSMIARAGDITPVGAPHPGAGTSMTISTEEVRFTDPTTGAQKGRKPQRYSLLPIPALAKIAEVYDYGSRKYDANNWRKGYPWSWSYDALQRHLNAFWDGTELDGESGLPHLAHAGFHVLGLLTYSIDGLGSDDRFVGEGV